MNMITSSYITAYLSEKFGSVGKFSASLKEFIMPSIFIEDDWKKHLSINVETGLWQDFKAGEKGNFIKLYSIVEGMSYKQAEADLTFKTFFLEEEPEKLNKETKKKIVNQDELAECELFPVSLESHSSSTELVKDGWAFLFGRGLFDMKNINNNKCLVCTEGRFEGRLIIPFEKDGFTFYFQARALSHDMYPKYLNPSVESGIRTSTVLYPYDEAADHLIVCEGPLDAISLQRQGINATCTLGCHISNIQMDMLKQFEGKLVFGYDNDEAGGRGIENAEKLRKKKMMPEIYILHPPSEVNDWNDAHVQETDLKMYMHENLRKYDFEYQTDQMFKTL